MRIALGIEYNGLHFYGWQYQPGLRTIQGHLEEALSIIADEAVQVFCAGRTDAGVHAVGQVVHFDTTAKRLDRAWVMGTNTHLPDDIAVQWALPVDDTFHARYSALSRTYRYVIYCHPSRPAILSGRVTWYYQTFDIERMRQATRYLLGEQDFSSFRAAQCQAKTANRCVHSIDIHQYHHFIVIEIKANAFLHHMVRNIVGVLKKIGEGLQPPDWAGVVLAARDRRAAATTAPPDGLYLSQVTYPEKYKISTNQSQILVF